MHILILGAGVFGVTAALALRRRGHAVTLCDPGPLPHPLAASTDISKVIRMEYGADEGYTSLMEDALRGWRAWNTWFGEDLYHEVGVAFFCAAPPAPGGFEYESFRMISRRGHPIEPLSPDIVRRRFPAWDAMHFGYGIFHAQGGYAESGRVMSLLVAAVQQEGVQLILGARVGGFVEAPGGRCGGVVLVDAAAVPTTLHADEVIVAAGAWTPQLLPQLAADLLPRGQPVFHLRPKDPAPFAAPQLPVFGGDISRLGYYGFPANAAGLVKIAHHGPGRPMDADDPREVTPAQEAALHAFLRDALPTLAEATMESTRLCLYCDTSDGHFLIDRLGPGLCVATGGSGHAFKFAPVLGDLIADAVEGRPGPLRARFAHRPERRKNGGAEAARQQAPTSY